MGEPAERRKTEKGDLERRAVLTHPAFQKARDLANSEGRFAEAIDAIASVEREYAEMDARLEEANRTNAEKDARIAELKKMAFRDGMTGAYNHRYFMDFLEDEVREAEMEGKPLSLLMIDIDYFKKFNDIYGHKAGDYVLKQLTHIADTVLRETDKFTRYGGEEFAVIMPLTTEEEAEEAAERLRKAVKDADLEYRRQKLDVTISIGVASHKTESVDDFITKADQALYAAKDAGRDCVISRSYAEKELGVDLSQYSSEKAKSL